VIAHNTVKCTLGNGGYGHFMLYIYYFNKNLLKKQKKKNQKNKKTKQNKTKKKPTNQPNKQTKNQELGPYWQKAVGGSGHWRLVVLASFLFAVTGDLREEGLIQALGYRSLLWKGMMQGVAYYCGCWSIKGTCYSREAGSSGQRKVGPTHNDPYLLGRFHSPSSSTVSPNNVTRDKGLMIKGIKPMSL
jgi:hypothetical protein